MERLLPTNRRIRINRIVMKKLITAFVLAIAFVGGAFAQTAEEILAKMEETMTSLEPEGIVMVVDTKIPIIGTLSVKTYTRGDKLLMKTSTMGVSVVIYEDATTSWTINTKDKKVVIEDVANTSVEGDAGDTALFQGVADGYNVSIRKETDKTWEILATKRKDNPKKEEPKNMEIVVAKGTFYPVSLRAKISGVTMTMRDISFGVSEERVTYNPDKYSGYTIEDKRK